MTDLSNLRRPEGAHRERKRLGRGPGSGKGKTSGKGHKGQKARTGHHGIPAWFEGGQMPIQRRVPKRGFKNTFKVQFDVVNLRDLEPLEDTAITPEILNHRRLATRNRPVKVLAEGNITRKIQLSVHAISAAARAKIEAAGGTVELLES